MRLLLLYGFLFFAHITASAQRNTTVVQVINADAVSGKPSCLLFSKHGFFYAATSDGLFLFNGSSLKPLSQKADSVKNITALFEDKNGVLWIGCSNGAVFSFSNNRIQSWKPQEGLSQKGISAFAMDAQGQLWMATKGEGVYVYSNQKLYNINAADGLSDDYVYDLHFINNQIIAATDQGISICKFSNGKKEIEVINTGQGLADNIVQTISADAKQKNKVWLGFQNGKAGVFDMAAHVYENVFQLSEPETSIKQILPLDEEVWMLHSDGFTRIQRVESSAISHIATTPLMSAAKDKEGNIWLFTQSGLYRSSGEQLQPLFTIPDDQLNFINDMLMDNSGYFWLTAKGGISCYQPSATGYERFFVALPLQSNSDITCLYLDTQQNIWIGTMGDGVFTYNIATKKIIPLSNADGMQRASILSITGNAQNVWINSLEGVWLYSRHTQFYEKFATASITGSAYIYYVFEDSKGRVWFATDGKGLSVWKNGGYTTFREKEGVTAKVIYAVAEDKYGNIWCNSLNNGIYKYDGKQFTHFSKAQGLPDETVSSISADANGNIFCVAAKECFLINASTGIVTPVTSPQETGVINTNLNSSFTKNNIHWFHAGTHIYAYRIASYKSIFAPQTKILNVELFLNAIDTTAKEFPHNENNLSVTFAGFYYSDPSKVSYQYKLEGYNNEWQSTKDGFVNFPKLSPGTYTFKVRSSVNENFENASEAVYKFIINKPFWRTWWFLLLSIITVTGILIFIIKGREAEVQKMQQLKTEKLKSQYETLKNQVNPHFLFNSFNTLLNVIDEDPKKAAVYVEHLSDFYRSIVNLREKDLIPLGEELKIIEHYFFIQKKRFGEALQFVNEVAEGDKIAYSIPPLTLQLLAENAIKHNAVSKDKPLTLHIHTANDALTVENNINPKLNTEIGEGLGLQNIKNRFQLIANKEVKIEHTQTTFIVTLPLIKVL
jgi:ligand-binding sensor domain-containing protein/uncharacterized membrane-anchored protein YhcB (DUF1043 family)